MEEKTKKKRRKEESEGAVRKGSLESEDAKGNEEKEENKE